MSENEPAPPADASQQPRLLCPADTTSLSMVPPVAPLLKPVDIGDGRVEEGTEMRIVLRGTHIFEKRIFFPHDALYF